MVDDAYITLRVADNFLHGYGLRWNISERVQVYTHPLWLAILSVFYAITREGFFTLVFVSFLTCVATFLAFESLTKRRSPWCLPAMIIFFMASKATMDFSSSGLENPLSELICVTFVCLALQNAKPYLLFLLAACAFLSRQDSYIVYLPTLLLVLWQNRTSLSEYRRFGIASLPIIAWVLFSLIYYGFVQPNTAFAKLTSTGITSISRVAHGFTYLLNSLAWDPITLLTILFCTIVVIHRPQARALTIMIGVVGYLVYIVYAAGSASHMSGRFLTLPYVMSVAVLILWVDTYALKVIAMGAAGALLFWTGSPLHHRGCRWEPLSPHGKYADGLIDTRHFVCIEGAALINYTPGERMPLHDWYKEGLLLKKSPERLKIGGPNTGPYAMGYYGFAAGPEKHIIDLAGLTDPVLARMPAMERTHWIPGHFVRTVPTEYEYSLKRTSEQRPSRLSSKIEAIQSVTQDPVWTKRRWLNIWRLNTGFFDRQ